MGWIADKYRRSAEKYMISVAKKYGIDPYDFDRVIDTHQDDDPETMVLDADYHAYGTTVPAGYRWNGSSSPNTPVVRWLVAKFYKSMKRSCLHDWLCEHANNANDRLLADVKFFLLSFFAEHESPAKCVAGLAGIRIGAKLGVGSKF